MGNIKGVCQWFIDRQGKLTYSMYGSRNGSDGTADCSGSISQALKENGFKIDGLPSTVTLGKQLANNGFIRISKNQDWDSKAYDIILMSWGSDMSSSGGSGGHVGMLINETDFISVDYWTGGQYGKAVSIHKWNNYYYTEKPSYIEVWRYVGGTVNTGGQVPNTETKTQDKAMYQADEIKFVNGMYQIKSNFLCPVGFDWSENGIPVSMVNWVNADGTNRADGKDKDFKKGDWFSFELDEAHIRDTGVGGYYGGYYYRQFEFGQFGLVWLSCWNKDDLVNYYK